MAQKRNALGRGLDALLSIDDVKTEGSSSINEIELSKIVVNPNQPRREFDPVALQELADSIAEIGIIQPITLRKLSDDEYQIIAGERRFRASQMAGLTSIPAYIRTADDENVMEMALIENIQREDLNSVEIALAYQHLLEQYGLTQERLSERVGKKVDRHGACPCTGNLGRPEVTSQDIRRNTGTWLLRTQSRRNCKIAQRRRNRQKRKSQNSPQTSQAA